MLTERRVSSVDQVICSSHPFEAHTTDTVVSTIFGAVKYYGVLRFVATYPILELNVKALLKVVPSLSAKRKEHLRFTNEKIENHLQNRTESKDFLSYVKLLRHTPTDGKLNDLFSFSVMSMNLAWVTTKYSPTAEPSSLQAPKRRPPWYLPPSILSWPTSIPRTRED